MTQCYPKCSRRHRLFCRLSMIFRCICLKFQVGSLSYVFHHSGRQRRKKKKLRILRIAVKSRDKEQGQNVHLCLIGASLSFSSWKLLRQGRQRPGQFYVCIKDGTKNGDSNLPHLLKRIKFDLYFLNIQFEVANDQTYDFSPSRERTGELLCEKLWMQTFGACRLWGSKGNTLQVQQQANLAHSLEEGVKFPWRILFHKLVMQVCLRAKEKHESWSIFVGMGRAFKGQHQMGYQVRGGERGRQQPKVDPHILKAHTHRKSQRRPLIGEANAERRGNISPGSGSNF